MKSKYLYDVVCVCCQSVPRVASVRTVLCSVCVRITAHVTEWQEAAAVSRDITVISVNTVRSTRSSFREVCCVLTVCVCVFQHVPPVCSALAVSSAATVWTGLHVTPEPDSASVPLDHTALAVREVRRSSCTSTPTPTPPHPHPNPSFSSSECEQGTFGLTCSRSCDCAEDTPCDPVSGRCICASGETGVRCDSGESSNSTARSWLDLCVMCAVLCQTAVWPGSDPTVRSAVNVRTALSATAGTDAAGVWTAGSASRAHNVNLLEIINPLASELTFIIAYESEIENHNLMQLCIFLYFIVVISRSFLV